jgi:plasmid segregation protein ParM
VEIRGIDIGFGFTKVTNGRDFQLFKSVIGEAADIQFREQLLKPLTHEPHLQLEMDGHAVYVGELAERQSKGRAYTLDHSQMVAKFAKVLALAGLSLMTERNVPIQLVTGLPVSYYRRHKEELGALLTGRHALKVIDAAGAAQETVISIDKVRVIPQPFGSVFDLIFNEIGKASDKRFLTEKIGVVDIGFRTADYSICDRTRYSERGSQTTDSGIAKAFAMIAAALQDLSGINVELYRLYEPVSKGSIKIHGKTYDLKPLVQQAFSQLATGIAAEVERLWADDWDIDTVVITGGGGTVLFPQLRPLLRGDVLSADPGKDARLNNVRGYWKYGVHLWNR